MIMEDLFHYMEEEEEEEHGVSDLYLPWPSSTERSVRSVSIESFTYCRSASCCSDLAADEVSMNENLELNDSSGNVGIKKILIWFVLVFVFIYLRKFDLTYSDLHTHST